LKPEGVGRVSNGFLLIWFVSGWIERKTIMPRVKLKVDRLLSRGWETDSSGFEEIPVSVSEGESVLEMVRHLSAGNRGLRGVLYDEESQGIEANVIVILNGRIVNPYECSKSTLKEGDEVTFLPMVDGG
jgi:molybdopterin converting factor small subunit